MSGKKVVLPPNRINIGQLSGGNRMFDLAKTDQTQIKTFERNFAVSI